MVETVSAYLAIAAAGWQGGCGRCNMIPERTLPDGGQSQGMAPSPTPYHPPNQTPMPCTTPTGGNIEAAINRGPWPFAAENTIDVSQAEYMSNPPASTVSSVCRSMAPFVRQFIVRPRSVDARCTWRPSTRFHLAEYIESRSEASALSDAIGCRRTPGNRVAERVSAHTSYYVLYINYLVSNPVLSHKLARNSRCHAGAQALTGRASLGLILAHVKGMPMPDQRGWPDPANPGVPPNPQRTGPYLVIDERGMRRWAWWRADSSKTIGSWETDGGAGGGGDGLDLHRPSPAAGWSESAGRSAAAKNGGRALVIRSWSQLAALISALLGFAGSTLLYFNSYALFPYEGAVWGGSEVEDYNRRTRTKNRRSAMAQRIGIVFLCVAFATQAVSVIVP